MSSNLCWELYDKPEKTLSSALKYKLRVKYMEYGEPVDCVLCESDVSFLEGLYIAGIEGAYKLINLIKSHERVHVYESF
jgi:hypothetical protein